MLCVIVMLLLCAAFVSVMIDCYISQCYALFFVMFDCYVALSAVFVSLVCYVSAVRCFLRYV